MADLEIQDTNTTAIRASNAFIFKDKRITFSLLPIGDGLSLALKR